MGGWDSESEWTSDGSGGSDSEWTSDGTKARAKTRTKAKAQQAKKRTKRKRDDEGCFGRRRVSYSSERDRTIPPKPPPKRASCLCMGKTKINNKVGQAAVSGNRPLVVSDCCAGEVELPVEFRRSRRRVHEHTGGERFACLAGGLLDGHLQALLTITLAPAAFPVVGVCAV